jgi:hypothetical protein
MTKAAKRSWWLLFVASVANALTKLEAEVCGGYSQQLFSNNDDR